jgi:RNA polymerase sigma-70 factor (ECF subfamily)
MLEFQNGNTASFENLMRKYYKRVFNFLYRMLNDRESAEDLTQEVFLRVYKAAPSYKPQSKFQTWVYTIAKNLAFNELRRRKRPMISLDAGVRSAKGDEMPRQLADEKSVNALEELLQEEMAAAVRHAIEQLPQNQRTVVILYRYDKVSYEQISRTMGMSVSAIKSLLSRARENLRKNLAGFVKQ